MMIVVQVNKGKQCSKIILGSSSPSTIHIHPSFYDCFWYELDINNTPTTTTSAELR